LEASLCYHITVANVPFAPHSCSIRGAVTALHAGAACKISTVLLHDAKTRQDSHKLACTTRNCYYFTKPFSVSHFNSLLCFPLLPKKTPFQFQTMWG